MIKVYDEFTQLKEVILGNINKELVKYVPKDEQSLILDIFDQTIEDLDAIQKIYQELRGITVKGDQPTPPLLENSHLYIIVDPSELIPNTGPNQAVLPEPASTLALLGCCVIVTITPVPVVVKLYDCAFSVICSVTVKL